MQQYRVEVATALSSLAVRRHPRVQTTISYQVGAGLRDYSFDPEIVGEPAPTNLGLTGS